MQTASDLNTTPVITDPGAEMNTIITRPQKGGRDAGRDDPPMKDAAALLVEQDDHRFRVRHRLTQPAKMLAQRRHERVSGIAPRRCQRVYHDQIASPGDEIRGDLQGAKLMGWKGDDETAHIHTGPPEMVNIQVGLGTDPSPYHILIEISHEAHKPERQRILPGVRRPDNLHDAAWWDPGACIEIGIQPQTRADHAFRILMLQPNDRPLPPPVISCNTA